MEDREMCKVLKNLSAVEVAPAANALDSQPKVESIRDDALETLVREYGNVPLIDGNNQGFRLKKHVMADIRALIDSRAPADQAASAVTADPDAEMLKVIDERDAYHDMADQLAEQIAQMTETDIGEHRSANEPWCNALFAGDEFISAKFKAFLKDAETKFVAKRAPQQSLAPAAEGQVSAAAPAGLGKSQVFAICDAYESGMGHGLQRDGHKDGSIWGNPDCGAAYEIGYELGDERASEGQAQTSAAVKVLQDLVRYWDSASVCPDDDNERMCDIEDRVRAVFTAQSADKPSNKGEKS